MRNVDNLPKQCVLCGRQWGPYMRTCCTPTSLVAVSRPGFLMRKPTYYDLQGRELTEWQLEEMREREKQIQVGRLQQPERPAAEPKPADVAQQPTPSVPHPEVWETERNKLHLAFCIYIVVLIAFWAMAIGGFAGVPPVEPFFSLGFWGTLASYIVATVRAYKLQRHLDTLGLCKPAAGRFLLWTVVVFVSLFAFYAAEEHGYSVALLGMVSPYVFGFYLPYSVLRRARRIEMGLFEQARGEVAGPPDHSKWQKNAANLRLFFWIGLVACCVFWASLYGYATTESESYIDILGLGALGLLMAWFPCVLYSYRVQKQLHALGLCKHGAWHVVVAGLMLTPYVALYLAFSVLRLARRVTKQLAHEAQRESDKGPPADSEAPPALETAADTGRLTTGPAAFGSSAESDAAPFP